MGSRLISGSFILDPSLHLLLVIMKMKISFALLFLLSTLLKDVFPGRVRSVGANEGEMAVLRCRLSTGFNQGGYNHGDAKLTWTNHTARETNNLSSVGETRTSALISGRNFVILKVSIFNQGIYSCSLRNTSSRNWFNLTVIPTRSLPEHHPRTTYNDTCDQGKSCTLKCPHDLKISTLISNNTAWHKDHGSLPTSFDEGHFNSIDEKDSGYYTCTRSYQYHGHLYNMTRTTFLKVNNNKYLGQHPMIISPPAGKVFDVLDLPLVVHCEAVVYSYLDGVHWINVTTDKNLPVYYNTTKEQTDDGQIKITASLVVRKVSEANLSNSYTCKLESSSTSLLSSVTVSLARRPRPVSLFLVLGIAGSIVAIILTSTVIYVKFKTGITLFVRDKLGCSNNAPDGKSYDAYIMCYESDTETGFDEEQRRWLEKVLEEELGYNLCLYDRDVSPGEAVADAVMGCVEQSRRVVLIPSSQDPGEGFGLLSAIHTALVERQTRLVLINTELNVTQHTGLRDGTFPEALRLLAKAGHSVTWRGPSSQPLSSSFWKELRYRLPAPRHLGSCPTDSYTIY